MKKRGSSSKIVKQSDSPSGSGMDLATLLEDAKSGMQNKKSKNGITVAIVGGSGRGKSTLLRKVFLDKLYQSKDWIVQVFTESSSSDALQNLPKDVTVDGMGINQDCINSCYKANQDSDKRYNFVMVLDDCIHIRYAKAIERMFLIMRNTNLTSIVSLQHPSHIPVSIRNSVYFLICMGFNGDSGVEQCIRTWLSGYLPGKTVMDKIDSYKEWAHEGHCFFLLDNLNHKCYKVDEDYQCTEIFLQSNHDHYGKIKKSGGGSGGGSRKRKREEGREEEEESDEGSDEDDYEHFSRY
jgi:hypothetical protein